MMNASYTRQAWDYYKELRAGGWGRTNAKAIAAAYRSNLIWDAERACPKLATVNRGGQI
jgi:hypothetical protein